MPKETFSYNEDNCHHQIGLKFIEQSTQLLYLEQSFIWCWNLAISDSRSELPSRFWDIVWRRMEKISWTDHVRNELLYRVRDGSILQTINRGKAKWIGHSLHKNWLLNQLMKERQKDKVMGRRGRRCKQLLYNLEERKGYWKLKGVKVDRMLKRLRTFSKTDYRKNDIGASQTV